MGVYGGGGGGGDGDGGGGGGGVQPGRFATIDEERRTLNSVSPALGGPHGRLALMVHLLGGMHP